MAQRNEIVGFLNKYLKIDDVEDKYLVNGLLFEGKDDVTKIAFAVDSSVDTISAARSEGADMLVVHHGFLSKVLLFPIVRHLKKIIKVLVESDVSLYGAHIPLDVHPDVGNNIELCRMFDVSVKGKFSHGFWGEFKNPVDVDVFVKDIDSRLNTKCSVFGFGKKKIKTVAFVSGGAQYDILPAMISDIDCLVTGENGHITYLIAKDAGMNMISAGHYATETLGVRALSKVVKDKFKVETVFIDKPTGL
ncbi:MAG: Nif3-like dinuclear metal center hexameric protein [Candidatus Aenigmarchaeota archaeon]|nr:Nif3-like dinuclear metal center hexameric protein [Candidatus Aenigmarchaeota archaeon]